MSGKILVIAEVDIKRLKFIILANHNNLNHAAMDLLKKITLKNSVFAQVLWVIIILISVLLMGYMVGKFAWYLSH